MQNVNLQGSRTGFRTEFPRVFSHQFWQGKITHAPGLLGEGCPPLVESVPCSRTVPFDALNLNVFFWQFFSFQNGRNPQKNLMSKL